MDTTKTFDIAMPSYNRSKCSPELERDFSGLKISAPATVSLSDKGKIPICGAYRLSNTVDNLLGNNLIEETTLVFVNDKICTPISFNLIPDKEPQEGGRQAIADNLPELSADNILKIEEVMTSTYFNIDALMFNADFPRVEATYIVYAVNRNLKSNVIEIKVSP